MRFRSRFVGVFDGGEEVTTSSGGGTQVFKCSTRRGRQSFWTAAYCVLLTFSPTESALGLIAH